jgi:hypothetical protein
MAFDSIRGRSLLSREGLRLKKVLNMKDGSVQQ